jgi:peptidoglycan/xylan/chitin deacetylase (PgdA/CDA1 family)
MWTDDSKNKLWRFLSILDQYTGVSRFFTSEQNIVAMYHSVGKPEMYGNISLDRFRQDIKLFVRSFEIVDLPSVLDPKGTEQQLAITFDDGYGNFYRHAYPILREFDIPVTVFVTTQFIGNEYKPSIRRRHNITSVDQNTMMDRDEVEEIIECDLITVGNHTRTHPMLSTIDKQDKLENEIVGAKEELEDWFGVTVDRFSYPYGDITPEASRLVRDSHSIAVTSQNGLVSGDVERYRLPRVYAHNPQYQFEWEMTGLSQWIRAIAEFV